MELSGIYSHIYCLGSLLLFYPLTIFGELAENHPGLSVVN